MQITVNIPDPLYRNIKEISDNVESSVIHALEIYAEREKLKSDPFFKWLNTPFKDKEGKSDVSVNHDDYIYKV